MPCKAKYSCRESVFKYAADKYKTNPEYLWASYPEYAVLRHLDNKKWYAVIMNVQKKKLGLSGKDFGKDVVDILDVKVDPVMGGSLLAEKGFMPAYHMHKGNWITVLLDGTVSDDMIFFLLDMSFELTASKKTLSEINRADKREWLVPANPKYYDIEKAFAENDTIMWKQSSNISVGDIIYIYMAAPFSAIRYKCVAEEVNIPYKYDDGNVSMRYVMKIRLLHRFDDGQLNFAELKELGVRAVRGPRSVPYSLHRRIEELCKGK